MLLRGKRALITGVANTRSIAWGIASAFHREGAHLAFTHHRNRSRRKLLGLLQSIGEPCPVFSCDVQSDEQIEEVFAQLRKLWGGLDIVVHSIAFANRDDLSNRFSEITRDGYAAALDISAYSLLPMSRQAAALMTTDRGGSILALSFNAVKQVAGSYGVMAVVKSALETQVRYLAAALGPRQIRVNALSAGPLRTLASSAIRGVSRLREHTASDAPLRRNVTLADAADAAVFLACDLSRAVTGNVLFVDSGLHLIGSGSESAMRGATSCSYPCQAQPAP